MTMILSPSEGVHKALDSLSHNPRAVTDWGPLIQSALDSGIRRFQLGPHDYPFSTQIDFEGKVGVTFEGASGLLWPKTVGTDSVSRLIWQGGAGSGVALRMVASDSIILRDLAVCYVAGSGYDGDLISHSLSNEYVSSFHEYHRCYFGPDDTGASNVKTARSLVALSNAVAPKLYRCSLLGAQSLVRGNEEVGAYCTNVSIEECEFAHWSFAAIANPGYPWNVTRSNFEYNDPDCVAAIDSDIGSSGTPLPTSLVLEDCYWWDSEQSGQMVINQRVGHRFVMLDVRSGYYHFAVGSTPLFSLNGSADYIRINGGRWDNVVTPWIDLGDPVTAFKRKVDIDGLVARAASSEIIVNANGHGELNIGLIPRIASVGYSQATPIRTVGPQSNYHSGRLPTIAAHPGAVGVNWVQLDPGSSDLAGTIIANLSNTATGLVFDLEFGTEHFPASGGPAYVRPIVLLTPLKIVGSGAEPATTAIAPENVYVEATNADPDVGVAGFTVGINGAITANGVVAWSYYVLIA